MQDPAPPKATRGLLATLLFVARHPFEFFQPNGELPTRTSPLVFAAFTYAVGIAGSMLYGATGKLRGGELAAAAIAGAVIGLVIAIPQIYIASGIAHATARLLGVRGPFRRTLLALAFATAPVVLLLFPFGGLVGIPAGIALGSIGIKRLHALGWGRAVTAAAMPVVLPVVLAVGLRTFVVEAFMIPSGSMAPTVEMGDHIFITKFAYGVFAKGEPKLGDVIVFERPDTRGGSREDYVKRVVGIPGDVITVEDGRISIGGAPVPLCRVGTATVSGSDSGDLFVEFFDGVPHLVFFESGLPSKTEGPYTVAPNEIFVMGDNRNNAADSRSWFGGRGGGVPFSNVKGRASMIWLPLERFGLSLRGADLGANAPAELRAALAKCLTGRG